jgi:hypothetical protein
MADARMELRKVGVKRAFDIIFGGEGHPEYIGVNHNTFNELCIYIPLEKHRELGFSFSGIRIIIDERIEDHVAHLYYNV